MEEYDSYYQTPDFVSSYRDSERVTMRRFEIADKALQRTQNLLDYGNVEEMILSEITFYSLQLQGNGVLMEDDVATITGKFSVVPHGRYKNPFAYVLGYVATRGSREIVDFKTAHQELIQLKDPSVSDADVVRYARLWLSLV
jgi:hypothetical protein